MDTLIAKHSDAVIGSLSGFDRLVFRGTLRRLSDVGGMRSYLRAAKVLLKDFGEHAKQLTQRLKGAAEELAAKASRPFSTCLPAPRARKRRRAGSRTRTGSRLVCMLRAVEPCASYDLFRNREAKRLELEIRARKCLHIYHYQVRPVFGFINARVQTWFPFSVQICVNGREWLARQMTEAGIGYLQRDNCFTWLEDPVQAQNLMDRQLRAAWPELLDDIARTLNPFHEEMFEAFPMDCYWSTFQSEWATDVLFRDAPTALPVAGASRPHDLLQPGHPALSRTSRPRGRCRRGSRPRGCGSSIGSQPTPSRCMTSRAACSGSRRPSTM